MSTQNNGGPAYPVQDASTWQGHGMTLRDYFAAKAMQSYLARNNFHGTQQAYAKIAYAMADAMLAARGE